MFSSFVRLIFVVSAFSPMLFVIWSVEIIKIFKSRETLGFIAFSSLKFADLFNQYNLIFLFLFFVIICYLTLSIAKTKLTKNRIDVKSIKTADNNLTAFILSYFLPCIDLLSKTSISIFVLIFIMLIIVFITKNTYFYNPLIKLFGYKYFEITTTKDVSYLMISKKRLINKNQINAYSQITDFVILNASE